MAVTIKSTKAKLQLANYDRKTVATYANVDPTASANLIAVFMSGINALRADDITYGNLVIESEVTGE